MKRVYHVGFGFSSPQGFELCKRLLELMGKGDLAVAKDHAGYDFTLEECDSVLQILLPELARARRELTRGFAKFVREERIYTQSELLEAELLRLIVPGQAGPGGDFYGTQFDSSTVCPGCGVRTAQISELVIDKTEMGKKDIAHTYEFEYIVSERLGKVLREARLSGLELRPVRHKSTRMRSEPVLWQLMTTCTLPPMAPPTQFERTGLYCPQCGKHGLYLQRSIPGVDVAESELFYRQSDLQATGTCDFNKTYEHFGEGRFTKPLIVISARAYRVFRDAKVRGIQVEPINIID